MQSRILDRVYDLKIIGGTVVDGTGADRYLADIGIKDGGIVEVRRRDGASAGIEGDAAETIDATGRIVTPGFVDVHTHYDGQVSWDEMLEPSSLPRRHHRRQRATAASASPRSVPAASSG